MQLGNGSNQIKPNQIQLDIFLVFYDTGNFYRLLKDKINITLIIIINKFKLVCSLFFQLIPSGNFECEKKKGREK